MQARGSAIAAALSALFFASGTSALVFETLWFHQAGLAFGSSVWASSVVLAAFMGGLALGGALTVRFRERIAAPLRAYALLEITIGVTGVALVYLLPAFGRGFAGATASFAEHTFTLNVLRFAFSLVLLGVPSTAMGMTLPLLTRVLARTSGNYGSALGHLYGINTLGSVAGAVATEGVLVAVLGIRGAACVAGAVNLVAGSIALFVLAPAGDSPEAKSSPESKTEPATPATPAAPLGLLARTRLFAAFLAGFVLLGLEVVWIRFLVLFLNNTTLVFSMILACVLAGIALGGLAGGRWLAKDPRAHRFAGPVALAAALAGVLGYRAFPYFAEALLKGGAQGPGEILGVAAPLVMPTCIASGLLLPLVGASLRQASRSDMGTTGLLASVNTVGAALGSLFAGFVLLPAWGMERALFTLFLLYGVTGALLLARAAIGRRAALLGALLFAAGIALFPWGRMNAQFIGFSTRKWLSAKADRVAAVMEGLDATIAYVEHRVLGAPRSYQLLTNAYSMSATDFSARRYMKLFVYWPVSVRPSVEKALLIGYGVGNTAKAMVDTKSLVSIDVVDISRDVLDLNRIVYPEPQEAPLSDPRVRVHIEDGRYFLEASRERFDLITGEPPPYDLAGVSNLYSKEYFQLLRRHLSERGVVTYWLHVRREARSMAFKSILRAFCDAFDDCSLWHASDTDFMMVGTNDAQGPIAEDDFVRQWHDPGVEPEMRALGLEHPEQLGALFIGDAAYLETLTRGAPPVDDDHPHRLTPPPSSEPADALVRAFFDEEAARARFLASPFITGIWPATLREPSAAYFEHQGLLNELLNHAPGHAPVKSFRLLEEVLSGCDLRLPVLLLLDSDPDIERALGRLDKGAQDNAEVIRYRAIGKLADRDFAGAAQLLRGLASSRFAGTAAKLLRLAEAHTKVGEAVPATPPSP